MGRHRLPTAPHSGGKRGTALRTGLLGVSVAVALGTAAVTTGMVPVGGSFPYVGVSGTDAPTAAPRAKASADPDAALRGLANLSGRASASTGPGTASPSRPASPPPPPAAARGGARARGAPRLDLAVTYAYPLLGAPPA
ncbi:hypothetical protein ACFVZQ_33080, partial [Streptomyces sp. NPDC059538]